MKKIIFIIFLILPLLSFSQSVEVSESAQMVYEQDVELFNAIWQYSYELYPEDKVAMGNERNAQSKAYLDLLNMAGRGDNVELFQSSVLNNTKYDALVRFRIAGGKHRAALQIPIDWVGALNYYRRNK